LPIKQEFDPEAVRASARSRQEESSSSARAIRVLAFIEASSLTGPAKNLIEFARRTAHHQQSSLRVNLAIATFYRGGSLGSNEFTLACQCAGVKLHVIQEQFAFDFSVIPAIRRLIAAYDPQIVQTHNVKSHFLMRLTRACQQRRWIAFHHGYTWSDLKVRLYNQLDRWSLPSASKVVTVCRQFATDLESIGISEQRIAIRHNSVNLFLPAAEDRVLELRRSLRIPDGTQVMLTVGRLSREKGQADLIEAVSLLRKEDRERQLRLVVVGDGPDSQRLKEAARTSEVADWIVFAGHQADVSPYYTMADLMVLPSHTEGSPNSLLEAMAAGLPIVATAVGGVPEIVITEKDALLVEKHNPAALARAIARVLRDGNLRRKISAAARNTAGAYSPAAYYDFMLSVYSNCLAADS
jgi:glycosyltransferase involved in cell wall biosynthesis